MSKSRIILILGIIVALLPFSGFPTSWKEFFFIIIGISIAYLAYKLKAKKEEKNNTRDTYVQNQPGQ